MLLRYRINLLLLSSCALVVVACYLSSIWLLNTYLERIYRAEKNAIFSVVEKDIEVFERLLYLVEQSWEEELKISLPTISEELVALNQEIQEIRGEQLSIIRDRAGLSDLHLINSDLKVVNSTFDEEVGLDMNQYGELYSSNLTRLIQEGGFFSHRASLSTQTGQIKKYAYYSAADTDFIVNGDFDLSEKLEGDNNQALADFLFGEYQQQLSSKFDSIESVDVFIISHLDQWSLFNPGVKVDDALAKRLYRSTTRLSINNRVYLPLDLSAYKELGFTAVMQLSFKASLIKQAQRELWLYLSVITLFILLIALLSIMVLSRHYITGRFYSLFNQIQHKIASENKQAVSLSGNDEFAQLASAVNALIERFKTEKLKNRSLKSISRQDSLTGLMNRRALDERLSIEWRKSQLIMEPLSVLMIDVDHFKQYNDARGHLEGDRCLQALARCMQNVFNRESDFIARFGGEEFVCLLPQTTAPNARQLARELTRRIAKLEIYHPNSETSDFITVSIGCLSVDGDADLEEKQLLEEADRLLYQSKQKGRACISSNHISAD